MKRFCPRCKDETRHTELPQTGFFVECVISVITNFKVSHLSPTLECNRCGLQR